MEQYLQALAFSNDLLVYIGEKIDVPTEDFLCRSDVLTRTSRFNSAIGKAVWSLITLGTSNIRQISQELEKKMGRGENEIFAKFAMQSAVEYFPKGYGHCEFFAFCAAVIGAAVQLYLKDDVSFVDEMVFEMAAGVIGTVLTGHVVVSTFDCSDRTWQEMTEVAESFNAFHGFED